MEISACTAEFTEKTGWLRKKKFRRIVYEASLHKLKDVHFEFVAKRKAYVGYLKFHAHNNLSEDSLIQFLKIPNNIKESIENYLKELSIKNPIEDSGIVLLDTDAPPPQRWLNERFK